MFLLLPFLIIAKKERKEAALPLSTPWSRVERVRGWGSREFRGESGATGKMTVYRGTPWAGMLLGGGSISGGFLGSPICSWRVEEVGILLVFSSKSLGAGEQHHAVLCPTGGAGGQWGGELPTPTDHGQEPTPAGVAQNQGRSKDDGAKQGLEWSGMLPGGSIPS